MNLKQIYLAFFSITLSIIALMYGVQPNWFAVMFLENASITTNASHVLRAVSGLYLSLLTFFVYGIVNPKYTDTAIVITAIFCLGLAMGRTVSILFDGLPSPILLVYVGMEYAIVPIAYFLLKKDKLHQKLKFENI
ncbi:DUF4345 domain-containing protein [Flammeovirga sp. EKP202]|uniref:DUF4345 domain-containing protein n=1 Tax=Flammeovirga sp. EKP202 TaxID=2770592 RepID=UPI00165FBC37|nr:DUF4345 domain-containing protein [Flammeovirga sp. EKP202]MBD0404260.1 DUF4345 domain-containing protein [Flammeovirga sp. EKP202]